MFNIFKSLMEDLKLKYPERIKTIYLLDTKKAHFMYKPGYTKEFEKEYYKQGDTLESHILLDISLEYGKHLGAYGFECFISNEYGYLVEGLVIETTSISYAIDKALKEACLIDDKGNDILIGSKEYKDNAL